MNENFSKTKFIMIASLILSIIMLIGIGQESTGKSNEKEVNHSSLVIIEVMEKNKNPKSFSDFAIKVKNTSEPHQEFSIVIKDEKLWNLINLNQTYMVNVSWNTYEWVSDINGRSVDLLQIENFELE